MEDISAAKGADKPWLSSLVNFFDNFDLFTRFDKAKNFIFKNQCVAFLLYFRNIEYCDWSSRH